MNRCIWANPNNELYVKYHDTEWSVPVYDDQKLFEFIVLESAQAGLSWEIILKKREGYRNAFLDFDPHMVARLDDAHVEQLLNDEGIIRNRLKIQSTIKNARAFLAIQEEFGSFSAYMWNWVDNAPIQNTWKSHTEVPATTDLSIAMSKDLKKRGFGFLGPTVWYAHMQAVGMVNDHVTSCFRHKEIREIVTGKHT